MEFAYSSPLHRALFYKKVEGGLRENVELFKEKCGVITHTSAFYEILLHCDLRKGCFMDTLFSSMLRKSYRKVLRKTYLVPIIVIYHRSALSGPLNYKFGYNIRLEAER